MPRETGNDYWNLLQDSEANWYGRILVPSVSVGTSPPNTVLVEPGTLVPTTELTEWLDTWDEKRFTMKTADGQKKEIELVKTPTIEELAKHLHNPRGLKLPTAPPLPFFQKSLPVIGARNVFIKFGVSDWSQPYALPTEILENDEQTVYFRTPLGVQGYLCSCRFCSKCWAVHDHASWTDNWNGYFGSSDMARRELAHAETIYQKQFIGHAGAIDRACVYGLSTTEGKPGYHYSYVNSWSSDSRTGRGILIRLQSHEVLYKVPTFVELIHEEDELDVPFLASPPPAPIAGTTTF